MVAAALFAWGGLAPVEAVRAAEQHTNSADRLITWASCSQVATLSDSELDLWKSRGVDGFSCMTQQLRGMGGAHDFTGTPGADLSSSRYELQRSLRDSQIVARAGARGMKMYLGAKLSNYYNSATPLREWFDDGGWSGTVLPSVGNFAAAAKQLGFAGLAFDSELYPTHGGAMTATWDWSYPGRSRSESDVRAKARQRGRELMTRIVGAFPGVELLAYDVEFPQTWGEVVQREVNGYENSRAPRLDIDFWDGLSSVEGYGAIRLIEADFYKTPHVGSWDNAFRYHYNSLYGFLSTRLSNWSYASSRLHVSPFAWIGPGPRPEPFDDARPVSYVTEQLRAFRKWGMGGEFADYVYGGLRSFDYSPYGPAMAAASTPAVVDTEPPALRLALAGTAPTEDASTAVEGVANDNLAVRAVRWASDRGHEGIARLTWRITSGNPRSGYAGEMLWSVPDIRLEPGDNRITITVEDIKGLVTSSIVTVRRGTVPSPPARPTAPAPRPPLRAGDEPPAFTPKAKKRKRVAKRRAARRRCIRRARARHTRTARRIALRRCAKRFRLPSR